MASLNQVSLIGHVGVDPKITTTQNGAKVASFTLATTEKGYTTKAGATVSDKTEWHNIVVWRGLAEVVEKYVTKGAQLFIQGKLRTRSYENKQEQKRYITEVETETLQLLGGKPQSAPQSQNAYQAQQPPSSNGWPNDPLPF